MDKNLIYSIIFTLLDIALLIVFIILLDGSYDMFIFWAFIFFPVLVALIVFFLGKFRKKLGVLQLWKRISLAYFLAFAIPLGIAFLIAYNVGPSPYAKYGVSYDPESIMYICRAECENALSQGQEFFQQCYDACMSRLR